VQLSFHQDAHFHGNFFLVVMYRFHQRISDFTRLADRAEKDIRSHRLGLELADAHTAGTLNRDILVNHDKTPRVCIFLLNSPVRIASGIRIRYKYFTMRNEEKDWLKGNAWHSTLVMKKRKKGTNVVY
jgi:hypothetical protein